MSDVKPFFSCFLISGISIITAYCKFIEKTQTLQPIMVLWVMLKGKLKIADLVL